eukprot:1243111-Rhodomonas_salina.3
MVLPVLSLFMHDWGVYDGGMVLRACYAMSGTDRAYGAMRCPVLIYRIPSCGPTPYAMSGTDLACAILWSNGLAMQCPVLT